MYSRISIARTRIIRIPDRSNTLADSMFRFLPFWTHIIVVGAIFTSQNRPKCEFNSHFGRFRLVKMLPRLPSYRSLTVFPVLLSVVSLQTELNFWIQILSKRKLVRPRFRDKMIQMIDYTSIFYKLTPLSLLEKCQFTFLSSHYSE